MNIGKMFAFKKNPLPQQLPLFSQPWLVLVTGGGGGLPLKGLHSTFLPAEPRPGQEKERGKSPWKGFPFHLSLGMACHSWEKQGRNHLPIFSQPQLALSRRRAGITMEGNPFSWPRFSMVYFGLSASSCPSLVLTVLVTGLGIR